MVCGDVEKLSTFHIKAKSSLFLCGFFVLRSGSGGDGDGRECVDR